MSTKDKLFAIVCECARVGTQCPTDRVLADLMGCDGGRISGAFQSLEGDGLVTRETMGYSRVITILDGPEAGKSTAPRADARGSGMQVRQAVCEICHDSFDVRRPGPSSRTCPKMECRRAINSAAVRAQIDAQDETAVHWPSRSVIKLPADCFVAHNIPLRGFVTKVPRPDADMTLGGVPGAWAVR